LLDQWLANESERPENRKLRSDSTNEQHT